MKDKSRPKVVYSRIGVEQPYSEVWDIQKHLQQQIIQRKRTGYKEHPGYLLICEHSPVYTIGKSGNIDHLMLTEEQVEEAGFSFFKINRGGDITYHGPGQLTVYPILDLDQFYNDVHRYVRDLEEVIIRVLSSYNIKGARVEGYTGVWIVDELGRRKICAIGVHMSRWVSIHGLAFNINTHLDHFDNIIPCGIQDKDTSVTSLSVELGIEVSLEEVIERVKIEFSEVFNYDYVQLDRSIS